MQINSHLLSVFICTLLSFTFGSQINTSVSKKSLSVGEHIQFQVNSIVPKDSKIIPPETENGFGNITVKEWTTQKNQTHDNLDSVTYSYIITTYIPERCTIPPLPYIVQNGQAVDTLRTQPITLDFQSVITSDSADIKDLKAQQIAGKEPLWWLWVLIAIVVLVVIFFIYKRFHSKKSNGETAIPLLPPYEEAMAAIHELERAKYLQRGLIREYVFDLSEILKRYIARRFSINASEFTTEEMLAWLGISDLDSKLRQSAEWFFTTTDPIKFARHIPEDSQIQRFMTETIDFLNATRPVLDTPNASVQPNAATSGKPSEADISKNSVLSSERDGK